MNLSKREHWLGLAALAIVGLFLLDRWAITPLWNSYRADVSRAAALEEELFETQLLLRREQDLKTRWRQRLDNGVGLSASESEGALLGAMERWATQSGVSLTSMKPERRPPEKGLQVIRCRAAARGSMQNLTRLCWSMENAEMPLQLEKLQIACSEDTRDAVTLQLEVSTICLAPQEEDSKKTSRTE